MPVYNCAGFVGETMISVLEQTFTDFELIVVDDFSTDNSLDIIRNYKDSRMKIIQNSGRGAANAYNTGIKNSVSEFVAIIDHDDIAHRELFEKQFAYLRGNTNTGITGCWYNVMSESGRILHTVKNPASDREIKAELMKRNCINNSGLMLRKKVFEECGYYDQSKYPVHDYELFLRASRYCLFNNIPEVLQSWRSRKNSPSNSGSLMRDAAAKLLNDINLQIYHYGEIDKAEFLFRKGRIVYYYSSPAGSAKYFLKSLTFGNLAAENIRFAASSVFLSPLIWLFRNGIVKYRYGGFLNYHI